MSSTVSPASAIATRAASSVRSSSPRLSRRPMSDRRSNASAVSTVGRRLNRGELDLTLDAARVAIADAGLTVDDIDASLRIGRHGRSGRFRRPGTPEVQDALRLKLNWHSGGREGAAQIQAVINAVMAVGAGLARHVLVYRTVTESTAQGEVDGPVSGCP